MPGHGVRREEIALQAALLIATCLALIISLIKPPYPSEQWLQHGPTVVALAALAVVMRKGGLTTRSFACLVAFLWLHILGARYIYSYVPYDQWCEALFGGSPAQWWGSERNHYDRLVHFCFGLLITWPSAEIARVHGRLNNAWSAGFALCAILAISSSYEVLEWALAIVLAPDYADAYNGQQGDMWDSQKDMALALVGSLTATVLRNGRTITAVFRHSREGLSGIPLVASSVLTLLAVPYSCFRLSRFRDSYGRLFRGRRAL